MQADETHTIGSSALISLGSNAPGGTGAATSFVLNGRHRVQELLGRSEDLFSGLYATPAYPAGIGPDFVNAVMVIQTGLSAQDILVALHQIEAEAERSRTVRWGQRTLDLDLLALGDEIRPDLAVQTQWRVLDLDAQRNAVPDTLILPHPRLQDRAFVLVPLMQVAPDWVHPVLERSVRQMHDALPRAEIAAIKPMITGTPSTP